MLGGGVAAYFGSGGQRGDGTEQHDIAGAFDQQRQAGASAVERAVQIAAQGRLPGVWAGLGGAAHAMPAGAGQQHIEAAVALTDLCNETLPGGRAGRIADQHQAAGVLCNLLQRLAATADEHQVGAFGGV